MAAGTITYIYPVAGATAPTTAQANLSVCNRVVADIVFAAADTAATVTHNMTLANGTGALGIPKVDIVAMACGSAAVVPFWAPSTTVAITVDKNSTSANTGITVRVTISRPHSITN